MDIRKIYEEVNIGKLLYHHILTSEFVDDDDVKSNILIFRILDYSIVI